MVEKQIIIGMNKEILLEQICRYKELPDSYRFINLEKFGEKINLYKYQQEALQSVMTCLNIYFKQGKAELLKRYSFSQGYNEVADKLPITKDTNGDKDSFNLLEQHFDVTRNSIPFDQLCNRASFWMATGSGKTLVMIKLIEILFHLSRLTL